MIAEHIDLALLALILLPVAGAVLAHPLRRLAGVDAAITAAATTGIALIVLLTMTPAVLAGEKWIASWPWIPSLGLNVSLRLDGLSFLFALLALGIGLLVMVYGAYYLGREAARARFYALMLLFQASMLGLVLSENLILLLVFWELTSLVSFLLIGYSSGRAEARQGARLALFITGGGGLALLGGILLLGHIAGSFELSEVFAARKEIQSHALYLPMLALVLLGAFTKSAQFPFHFWLPHAMAAPTPVSAYLHSATMVKAGVFLLARLFPVLAGTDAWFYTVTIAGLVTLTFGAYTALFQHDLKGLLAYSTISHLGLITLLLGLGTPLSEVAALLHIINHAVFKASLFMAAGIIDHETGTRDMRRLSGLFQKIPYTATLAIVAAAAMAGVPLLNGFLSKEMFFGETLHLRRLGDYHWLMPAVATVAGALAVAYSLRFIHDTFFGGPATDLPREPHRPPLWMRLPVEFLVALCIAVGLIPGIVVRPLLDVAAAALLQRPPPEYQLVLWHGFTFPLAMSLIALLAGGLLYIERERLFALHARLFPRVGGKALAEIGLDRLIRMCRHAYRWIDNGSLQRYVALFLIVSLAASATALDSSLLRFPSAPTPVDMLAVFGASALIAAALAIAWLHHRRTHALVLVGVIGLLTALAFGRFSAPDLMLTQILVEFVTLILMLLARQAIKWHPRRDGPASC